MFSIAKSARPTLEARMRTHLQFYVCFWRTTSIEFTLRPNDWFKTHAMHLKVQSYLTNSQLSAAWFETSYPLCSVKRTTLVFQLEWFCWYTKQTALSTYKQVGIYLMKNGTVFNSATV